MRIIRFNENKFDSNEKVYKVTFSGEVDIPISKIEETDRYNIYKDKDKNFAILAGLEEYFYMSGDMHFDYKLYDGAGNPIENEELFDNTKKYNL